MSRLAHTPLHRVHLELGARMVPFAGFEMPLQYRSILAEHRAVRERAGLFDVSHMGQFEVRGPGATASLERLLTCPVASLRVGRVRYGLLCNERGGVVDDVTLYRLDRERYLLCVNAANIAKDASWIAPRLEGAEIEDRSQATALLALQGPVSAAILESLGAADLARLPRFGFLERPLAGVHALVSRTGYTGSDGFEIYLAAGDAEALFRRLLEAGKPHRLEPAGLGARDTLRIEAALPLYGHELDDETTPLEAGLERFVKLDAGGFLGWEALRRQRAEGLSRVRIGLVLDDRGVARAGHPIVAEGETVGRVTSGAPSPTLGKAIALGYVRPPLARPGTPLGVEVRGRLLRARVVETPFYRREPG